MTEPTAQTYTLPTTAPDMPRRAMNLAQRVLELEQQCSGRGRVEMQLIMLDEEWYLTISQPGPVEWLGA